VEGCSLDNPTTHTRLAESEAKQPKRPRGVWYWIFIIYCCATAAWGVTDSGVILLGGNSMYLEPFGLYGDGVLALLGILDSGICLTIASAFFHLRARVFRLLLGHLAVIVIYVVYVWVKVSGRSYVPADEVTTVWGIFLRSAIIGGVMLAYAWGLHRQRKLV